MPLKLELKVYDGGEPRRNETPDHFITRIHEGEERAMRLLALDAPEPSPDFDERFRDRLTALRIIERAERVDVDEVEQVEEADGPSRSAAAKLDALLAVDQPEPSAGFDAGMRFRLRREMAADTDQRMTSADVLRIPALPHHEMPILDAARKSKPFSRAGFIRVAILAAASLAATVWFTLKEQELDPPDEELAMVAHLDLLENYEEVETYDALEDEDTFEVVAALDTLEKLEVETQ